MIVDVSTSEASLSDLITTGEIVQVVLRDVSISFDLWKSICDGLTNSGIEIRQLSRNIPIVFDQLKLFPYSPRAVYNSTITDHCIHMAMGILFRSPTALPNGGPNRQEFKCPQFFRKATIHELKTLRMFINICDNRRNCLILKAKEQLNRLWNALSDGRQLLPTLSSDVKNAVDLLLAQAGNSTCDAGVPTQFVDSTRALKWSLATLESITTICTKQGAQSRRLTADEQRKVSAIQRRFSAEGIKRELTQMRNNSSKKSFHAICGKVQMDQAAVIHRDACGVSVGLGQWDANVSLILTMSHRLKPH